MKDPALWGLDDLTNLINTQAEESTTLEFKRADSLEDLANHQAADKRKKDISIDVSAFANRIGGIIIYGMEEDTHAPYRAKALSPINPEKCSKERLEQIISSRIKPPIQNLIIRPVSLNSDGYAYVVKIPASHTAHQASDKRYYRRVNFGNQAMEDDEIRQAMHRQARPTYNVKLIARQTRTNEFFFSGGVENTSVMVGHEVSTVVFAPTQMTGAKTEVINSQTYSRFFPEPNRLIDQLKPFASFEVIFAGTYRIPETLAGLTVPVYVRVYDQFGYAHEAEFMMSLAPESRGQLLSQQQFGRDATL